MNNLKVASKPSRLENIHIAAILGFVVSVFWAGSSEANSYDMEIEHVPQIAKPPVKPGSHKADSYDMEIEPYKPHDSSGSSPNHKVTRPATSKTPATKALRKELAKNSELGSKCMSSDAVVAAELTAYHPVSLATPSDPGVTGRATFKLLEFLKGPDLTNPISIDYSSDPQSAGRAAKVSNNTIVPSVGTRFILFLLEQEDGSWKFYKGHDTKLPYSKENLSAVERILKAAKMSRTDTKPSGTKPSGTKPSDTKPGDR